MKSKREIEKEFIRRVNETSAIIDTLDSVAFTFEQRKELLDKWREHNAWLAALNWVRQ